MYTEQKFMFTTTVDCGQVLLGGWVEAVLVVDPLEHVSKAFRPSANGGK